MLLIAVGAILTWAVTKEFNGIDIQVVGVILMVVGIVGIALDLIWWHSWRGGWGYRRATYVEGASPRAYPTARRTTYVEEDAPPPGPPPPGPPPP
jgi:hypothetical protein